MTSEQKFKLVVLLLLIIISAGATGYMLIENFTFLDALYMTVITISTVGFKEVADLSPGGRVFTIILIFSSISVVAYGISVISSFILEGHFGELRRMRKMEERIKKLREHYIVCGEGKVAEQVVEELMRANVPFIVVCKNPAGLEENLKVAHPKEMGTLLYIQGDPMKDEVLKEAKVEEARGLITCLPSDTDNLFVTLSARSLNQKLKIVAQAQEEISESKMLKAGADNVISPAVIGGRRMASIILRPTVVSFLDIMTRAEKDITLRLEEVTIPKNSPLVGKSISEAEIRKQTNTLVVAIKNHHTGKIRYTPPPSSILKEEDVLLVLGDEEGINKLCRLCTTP